MGSQRGGGRPRLPRGVIDLGADAWTPPDAVVLDTSAVVEFLLPSQRAHEHWRLFFTACAEHGTSLIATTDSGFATLPESTLRIVTDPHRVGLMRRRRAQWGSRQRN
jgi:hypothetical protein